MAEPTGESPPPQINPAAAVPLPPAREDSGESPPERPAVLPAMPRANPPSVFNQKEAAASPVLPAGFNDFLAWVQAFGGTQTLPVPAAEPAAAVPASKKREKFRRQDPEVAKADGAPVPPGLPPGRGAETARVAAGTAASPLAVAGQALTRKRRQKLTYANPRSYKKMLPWLVLLGLLGGSFVLGRLTVRRPVAANVPPSARASSGRAATGTREASLIDQAMAAEAKRDFNQANRFLEEAQKEPDHPGGIEYHLALLAFENADLPRALSLIDRSIETGEEVAACYNLRGTLVNRMGINRGMDDLEMATQLDPFDARYFYFLGEGLRRRGKPQAALERLRQATDRLREPGLEGLYRLKIRLAQIEMGQDHDFADELAAELRRTPPDIDWLFTAAAVELHRGNFAAAAGFLDKVLTLTDQETANVRLRDYFFYAFASDKTLARFFTTINQSGTGTQGEAAAATPAGSSAGTSPTFGTPAPANGPLSLAPPSSPHP